MVEVLLDTDLGRTLGYVFSIINDSLQEFALHARAILGLPIPDVRFYGPSASKAIVVEGNTKEYEFCNLEQVLEEPGVQIRFFGKPEIAGHRRVGVILFAFFVLSANENYKSGKADYTYDFA